MSLEFYTQLTKMWLLMKLEGAKMAFAPSAENK